MLPKSSHVIQSLSKRLQLLEIVSTLLRHPQRVIYITQSIRQFDVRCQVHPGAEVRVLPFHYVFVSLKGRPWTRKQLLF